MLNTPLTITSKLLSTNVEYTEITDAEGKLIFTVNQVSNFEIEEIVKMVNVHDELKKTLEAALPWIKGLRFEGGNNEVRFRCKAVAEKMMAALNKCKS